jgi:hypothetical protein
MSFDRSPLPVTIVDPRHPLAPLEGWVERIEPRPWRVDVDLLLADGEPAAACLTPDDALWLELRVGDIVRVEAIPTLPCSETPGAALALATA